MTASTSVRDFYDALASQYHLVFEDWDESVERQASALDGVIRALLGEGRRTVLDVACGIGTQSLGLAALGYRVTSSDLSPAAVERARIEARARDLAVDLSVGDMRAAYEEHGRREFDVVLCADNSLPHLLSDDEIAAALEAFLRCTRPGGLCIVSLRDYAAGDRGVPQVKPYGLHRDGDRRRVLLQVWEWRGALYDLSLYTIDDDGNECRASVGRTTYYAISVAELAALMERAGFEKVRRIDGKFFQPLVVGVRPAR
jgi:SAM-dependent methyltransferase